MPRIVILASLLLLTLSAPAFAAADKPETDATCQAADGTSTDYVQKGDDIILVECPNAKAADGAQHASGTCACHEPPGADGTCAVFACNSDGSAKEPPKPKPEPKKTVAKKTVAKKPAKRAASRKAVTPSAPVAATKKGEIDYVR